jgi:hypothetical protein
MLKAFFTSFFWTGQKVLKKGELKQTLSEMTEKYIKVVPSEKKWDRMDES